MMKTPRYWRQRTINAQQEHIEILKDRIETLEMTLKLEKSFRKYYQEKINRINE